MVYRVFNFDFWSRPVLFDVCYVDYMLDFNTDHMLFYVLKEANLTFLLSSKCIHTENYISKCVSNVGTYDYNL